MPPDSEIEIMKQLLVSIGLTREEVAQLTLKFLVETNGAVVDAVLASLPQDLRTTLTTELEHSPPKLQDLGNKLREMVKSHAPEADFDVLAKKAHSDASDKFWAEFYQVLTPAQQKKLSAAAAEVLKNQPELDPAAQKFAAT